MSSNRRNLLAATRGPRRLRKISMRVRVILSALRMDFHTHLIDRIAFLNGFISGIALFPQLLHVLTTPAAAVAVSPMSYGIILINSIVWVLYAMHRGLISLGIASSLNTLAAGAILIAMVLS